jgi:hypothetical protein
VRNTGVALQFLVKPIGEQLGRCEKRPPDALLVVV